MDIWKIFAIIENIVYNYLAEMETQNIQLEKLLLHHELDEKDRYEIRQIFWLVDERKKMNILNNFEKMVAGIVKIKQELKESQEILLGKVLDDIKQSLEKYSIDSITWSTQDAIWGLKNII